MSPATLSLNKKEISQLPYARIDAQDRSFVEPLREFLSSRGCDVSINTQAVRHVTYHIISGDVAFVKEIFSHNPTPATKRLLLLWQKEQGPPRLKAQVGEKIILVDARPLTNKDVANIFSFFFTARTQTMDIRKAQSFPAPQEPQERAHDVHTPRGTDETRITQTIREVFGVESSAKKKMTGDARAKKAKRSVLRAGVLALAVLLFSWIAYGLLLVASSVSLIWGGRMVIAGNARMGGRMIAASSVLAGASRRVLPAVGVQLMIVGRGDLRAQQEQVVSLLAEVSSAALGTDRILTSGQRVASSLFISDVATVGAGTVASDIAALRSDIASVMDHLALSQAQLDRLIATRAFPLSTLASTGVGKEARATLGLLRESIGDLDQLLTLYPHMAGFTQPQEFLLLFQNSMELRPTGGFIGSVGSLVFEDGRMRDFTVSDVYELDGQLKGHVDPPTPLRELLGLEHWYLRDSNWHPDFHASATQAAWFYEKEAGRAVQGVIGISVPFVIELLRATGPIVLPDVNDRITADNFFGKSLLYTQTDFFPGSTQKKDFLGSLASALIRRIIEEEGASPGALLRAITTGLTEKHILFYFPDRELEALVSQYGWTGEMAPMPPDCPSTEAQCPTDGIAVSEANVGVNKANYFVSREALHQVALMEDGASEHMLTLRYHNAATDDTAQGGGTYRAYVRLLVPFGTTVETVSVNGIAIRSRNLKDPQVPALPFAQLEEGYPGAVVVGVAFEVPPLGDSQMTISFRRAGAALIDGQTVSYRLLVRKQPGYPDTTWQISIVHPLFWIPTPTEGKRGEVSSVANHARVEYNTTLVRDEDIRIQFEK